MDFQTIINTVLPLVLVAVGWFCKEVWSAVQVLKDEVHDLRAHLAENYIHKSDFSDRWDEILKALHRLEDKLDQIKK